MASNNTTTTYTHTFKFHDEQSDYEFRIRRRRNWWWLLLLLLPLLLLLIRCEREITVTCVDDATGEPLAGATTTLSYTSGYLWGDGRPFVTKPYSGSIVTDSDGRAVYPRVGCSVYSYIFRMFSTVTATGDLYPYTSAEKTELLHFTNNIELRMKCDSTARDVDIVMCVDNTGSMESVIDMVKRNARKFHSDLIDLCREDDKAIRKVRVKMIVFGDFTDGPMTESKLFDLPAETAGFESFVNGIGMTDGGDYEENGLEAVSLALKTPWTTTGTSRRHVVVVYTDAATLPLGERSDCASYPKGLAADMGALRAQWDSMDASARRLVLFAPAEEHWTDISSSWPDVDHQTGDLADELTGGGYRKVLKSIAKSL